MQTHDTVPLSPEQIASAATPTPEKLAAMARREADIAFAGSAPLPGPAGDAFAGLPQSLFGFPLVPVTGGHIAVLHMVDSPFLMAIRLGMARAQAKDDPAQLNALDERAKDLTVTIEDIAVAMFVFTRPPAASRKLLLHDTPMLREEIVRRFKEHACAEILDRLPPMPNLEILSGALGEHYSQSFATALDFAASERGKSASINFPPEPPATGSVGS